MNHLHLFVLFVLFVLFFNDIEPSLSLVKLLIVLLLRVVDVLLVVDLEIS